MNVYDVVRLTADPELKYLPNGTAVCNFNVVWNDGFGDKQEASFIKCVTFSKNAENIQKFFTKGKLIFIKNGKLQQKRWETQDGQKKSNYQIVVNEWGFAGDGNKTNDKPEQTDMNDSGSDINLDDLPFN
jgi:single-strand DNA-binding protein